MFLNMCLYLSDSSTDLSILPQAYHALAEAHFMLNEHERAIDAGKECFKRRPLKSEVVIMLLSQIRVKTSFLGRAVQTLKPLAQTHEKIT